MKAASNPEWMPENPYPESISTFTRHMDFEDGCQQTARKIFVWLNSDCSEPHSEGFDRTHKDCKFCMQQFCKEVRL